MKCVVNWIPLRNCVRSRNAQPYLKIAREGFSECSIRVQNAAMLAGTLLHPSIECWNAHIAPSLHPSILKLQSTFIHTIVLQNASFRNQCGAQQLRGWKRGGETNGVEAAARETSRVEAAARRIAAARHAPTS